MAATSENAANKDFSDLLDTITCALCTHLMPESRTLYPCLHSFCVNCISQLPQTEKGKTYGVKCPMCQSFVSNSDIKQNLLMDVLIKLANSDLKKPTQESSARCLQCEKPYATSKCLSCNIDLCEKCKDTHRKLPGFQDHVTVLQCKISAEQVKNVSVYCSKHPSEQIKMNCQPCNTAICSQCKFESHDCHKSESIQSALVRLRHQTLNSLQNVQRTLEGKQKQIEDVKRKKKLLQENQMKVQSKMAEYKEKLINKLQEEYQALTEELNNNIMSYMKRLDAKVDSLENVIKSEKSVTLFTETVLKNTNGGGLLTELQNGLATKLEQLQKPSERHGVTCKYFRYTPTHFLDRPMFGSISEINTRSKSIEGTKAYTKSTSCCTMKNIEENGAGLTGSQGSLTRINTTVARSAIDTRVKSSKSELDKSDSFIIETKGLRNATKDIKSLVVKNNQVPSEGDKFGDVNENEVPNTEEIIIQGPTIQKNQINEAFLTQKLAKVNRVADFRVLNIDLTTLVKIKKIKQENTTFLNADENFDCMKYNSRLCLFENDLWIPVLEDTGSLQRHSLDSTFIGREVVKGIEKPNSMFPISYERLVVTSESGLYVIDSSVQTQFELWKESCQDVHVHNFVMSAVKAVVEDKEIQLKLFIWDIRKVFETHKVFCSSMERNMCHENNPNYSKATVLVLDHAIYLAHTDAVAIHRYSAEGELDEIKLSRPDAALCLLAADVHGNLLVADRRNDLLQVRTEKGKWLNLEFTIWKPMDVILVNSSMIVLYNSGQMLTQYKIFDL